VARVRVRFGVYEGFWRVLESLGVEDARRRWESKPPLVQRAAPPVVAAVLAVGIAWAAGLPPSPALLVLLAVSYALYLLPARGRRYALPAVALAVAVAYPFYLEHLFAIPIFKTFPSMDTMVAMAIFTVMALGLNMVVGYAGLLDLGYVAFYAIGAYVAGWAASDQFSQVDFRLGAIGEDTGVGGVHLSIWLVLIVAAAVTAVAGVIIGLPTLRLRGDYLAIVTLGFGEILPQIARNGDAQGLGFNLTNGPQGINPIDPPGFGGWLSDTLGLPANYLAEQGRYVNFTSLIYWTAIGLALLTLFCSVRLRDSRLGRAWIAIREDETAAAAMGIPLMRTKTWSYAAGAFFGGIAGAWFATFNQSVFADQFQFNISVFILCMVILGGMGNVWGVITGAAFLTYLNQEGLSNFSQWLNETILPCSGAPEAGKLISHGCLDAPTVAFGIYGAIIVAVMLFRPQGVFPEQRRKLEFETGVHDQPIQDVAR